MTTVTKTCKECGNEFVAGDGGTRRADAKFCSDVCRMKWHDDERAITRVYNTAIFHIKQSLDYGNSKHSEAVAAAIKKLNRLLNSVVSTCANCGQRYIGVPEVGTKCVHCGDEKWKIGHIGD